MEDPIDLWETDLAWLKQEYGATSWRTSRETSS
jgi:hypothetical protein